MSSRVTTVMTAGASSGSSAVFVAVETWTLSNFTRSRSSTGFSLSSASTKRDVNVTRHKSAGSGEVVLIVGPRVVRVRSRFGDCAASITAVRRVSHLKTHRTWGGKAAENEKE